MRLNEAALTIEQNDNSVTITTPQAQNRARLAIIAVPPTLAGRIRYQPLLPPSRDGLHQRLPMGQVLKVQVVYARPFWRELGLNGQVLSDAGPITVVFDNSPPQAERDSRTPGVLVGFAEGRQARSLGAEPPEARRAAVLGSLARYFGAAAHGCTDYADLDWSAEPYSGGCYGALFGPGVWTQYGPALRQPVGKLHWAGAESARLWMNYMDGAVESGERAAAEVRARLE